jgi:hypothetical protein
MPVWIWKVSCCAEFKISQVVWFLCSLFVIWLVKFGYHSILCVLGYADLKEVGQAAVVRRNCGENYPIQEVAKNDPCVSTWPMWATCYQNCALLRCYAAPSGNPLPMFWDKVSVPSLTFKYGTDTLSQKSVKDYHSMLRNIRPEHSSHQHRGGRLEWQILRQFLKSELR